MVLSIVVQCLPNDEFLPNYIQDQATVIFGVFEDALSYPVSLPWRDGIDVAHQKTVTTLITLTIVVRGPIIVSSLLMADFSLVDMGQGVKGWVVSGEVDRNEQKVGDR